MNENPILDSGQAWIETLQNSRSIQRLVELAEDSSDLPTVLDLLHAIDVLAKRITAMAEIYQAN